MDNLLKRFSGGSLKKETEAQKKSDLEKLKEKKDLSSKSGLPHDEKMKEGGDLDIDKNENMDECSCTEIFSILRWSATCTHYYHFVTNSYAEHKALNKYYDTITDLLDAFIEAYSGINGKMTGVPKHYECQPYSESASIEHLKGVRSDLEVQYEKLIHPNLKNEMDNIFTLIDTTIYLLSLK